MDEIFDLGQRNGRYQRRKVKNFLIFKLLLQLDFKFLNFPV